MAHTNPRSTTETIRELTDSSREIFEAGQRVAGDLNELEERMQRAMDWRTQYRQHTTGMLVAAALGGLLLAKTLT